MKDIEQILKKNGYNLLGKKVNCDNIYRVYSIPLNELRILKVIDLEFSKKNKKKILKEINLIKKLKS